MTLFKQNLEQVEDPLDYYKGRAPLALTLPRNILLFLRKTKSTLQLEALQDRSHHRFVLIFNLQTQGQVHVDELSFSFQPGQALLVFPYQFHHYSGLEDSNLEWLFCTFETDDAELLAPLRNSVVGTNPEIKATMQKLVAEWQASDTSMLQPLLLQLLLELKTARLRENMPARFEGNRNSLVRTVNEILVLSGGRDVSVEDIMKRVGLSQSRLRVVFKEVSGVPLGAYMQNYRISCALALLRNSTHSLAEVSRMCGFGSPQAFSRVFKHVMGISPLKFRKRGFPLAS